MTLSYEERKESIPIAKIKGASKDIIYLSPLPQKLNIEDLNKICPFCDKTFKRKDNMLYHIQQHVCIKKNQNKRGIISNEFNLKLKNNEYLEKIPLELEEHEVIFVTGPPKCGKTYWVNEYVKMFKYIYNKPVYRISRIVHDETIKNEEENYIYIPINDELQLKMEHFENSLIIFDDIESSEFPKASKMAFNFMDDVCKNGRHHKISVIFCNQECRMGNKTKPILSTVTSIVIFPLNTSLYQTEKLLKDHIGMSKKQINDALKLNSRWIVINRASPQYIMYDHGIYILGREFL